MQKPLDIAAISISGLCALHCLLTPVALVLLPIHSAAILADDHFHHFLLWFILPTSAAAIALGCRRHRDLLVLAMVATGAGLLVLGAFWAHGSVGLAAERLLALAGGGLIAAGHVRNYMLCQSNHCHTNLLARNDKP